MADFSTSKRHGLKEYDDLSKIRPCSREKVKKTVPLERTLDHIHSFTSGKVSSHKTRIRVTLFAMLGKTHSVVKLSLLL